MDGEKKTAKQKLILGTHTSEGEQNYLMIAEVALPTVDNEAEAAQYDEERGEVGGFGAATGRVQVCDFHPLGRPMCCSVHRYCRRTRATLRACPTLIERRGHRHLVGFGEAMGRVQGWLQSIMS